MKGAHWNPITLLGGPYLVFLEKHIFDLKFNKYKKPF